jgi:hypothetical protein
LLSLLLLLLLMMMLSHTSSADHQCAARWPAATPQG